MAKRTTVFDVAKRAGVSHTAVSMALRGSKEIGEEAKQRILKIVDEMDYYPRAAAQLLRSSKSEQLGIIVAASDVASALVGDFTGPILGHLVEICGLRNRKYVIEVCRQDNEPRSPYQVRSGLVDGSILIGDVGDALRQQLGARKGYAWVSVGEPAKYCVLVDAEKGAYEATRRLVELGHRAVAYVGGPQRYAVHRMALTGFRRAAGECDLRLEEGLQWVQTFANPILDRSSTLETVQWARAVLSRERRPTAVLCHGETLARSLIHAAAERGLRVPHDLSVISWGSSWGAAINYPCLTTVANDLTAMSQRALDMLERQIGGKPVAEKVCWIAPRLVEGDTLGPVPKS